MKYPDQCEFCPGFYTYSCGRWFFFQKLSFFATYQWLQCLDPEREDFQLESILEEKHLICKTYHHKGWYIALNVIFCTLRLYLVTFSAVQHRYVLLVWITLLRMAPWHRRGVWKTFHATVAPDTTFFMNLSFVMAHNTDELPGSARHWQRLCMELWCSRWWDENCTESKQYLNADTDIPVKTIKVWDTMHFLQVQPPDENGFT